MYIHSKTELPRRDLWDPNRVWWPMVQRRDPNEKSGQELLWSCKVLWPRSLQTRNRTFRLDWADPFHCFNPSRVPGHVSPTPVLPLPPSSTVLRISFWTWYLGSCPNDWGLLNLLGKYPNRVIRIQLESRLATGYDLGKSGEYPCTEVYERWGIDWGIGQRFVTGLNRIFRDEHAPHPKIPGRNFRKIKTDRRLAQENRIW